MQISDILKTPDNAPQQLELRFSPRHWSYISPSQKEIKPLVFITEFLLQHNFTFCQATTGDGCSEISHTGDAPYNVCYKNFSSFKNCFVDDFFIEQKEQSESSGGWISSLNYRYVDVHLMRDKLYLRASVSALSIVLQWLDIEAGDLTVIQSLWDALCRSFPDSPDNRHSVSTSFPLPKKYAKPQPVTPVNSQITPTNWLLDGPAKQAEPKNEEEPEIAWFPLGISFETTALRGGWQKESVYLHDNGTLAQGKIYLGVDDYSFSPAKRGAPAHNSIAINYKATNPLALRDGVLTLKTNDGSVCFTIPEELQASLQLWLDEKLPALSTAATLPTVFLSGSDKQICSHHPFLRAHCKDGSRLLQLLRDQFPVFSDHIDWFTNTGSVAVEKDKIQFSRLKNGDGKKWYWDESAEQLTIRMQIDAYGFFDDSEYHYHCEFTIRYLGNQPDAEAESLPPLPEKIDLASIFDRRNDYQAHWIAEDPFGLEGFYRITCATGN